jgi:hydrogenase maturation protein HypF
VLAFGAHLKATLCMARGREAFLSQHIGNLNSPAACAALDEAAEHLQTILSVRPAAVAHDAHPDYYSTRAALEMAARLGCRRSPSSITTPTSPRCAPSIVSTARCSASPPTGSASAPTACPGAASCCRWTGPNSAPGASRPAAPARGRPRGPRTVAHGLRRAARPRGADEAARRFAHQPHVAQVLDMLARGTRCPPTTSLGRCFDAAAGLLGLCETMTFEGQAAMLLETAARAYGKALPLPGGYHIDRRSPDGPSVLNLYPLFNQLAEETTPERGAAHFHASLVDGLEHWIGEAAEATGLRRWRWPADACTTACWLPACAAS